MTGGGTGAPPPRSFEHAVTRPIAATTPRTRIVPSGLPRRMEGTDDHVARVGAVTSHDYDAPAAASGVVVARRGVERDPGAVGRPRGVPFVLRTRRQLCETGPIRGVDHEEIALAGVVVAGDDAVENDLGAVRRPCRATVAAVPAVSDPLDS